VYSDRTRGELQVSKNNFFCSDVREWDLVDANVTFIGRLSMVDLQIACLIVLKRALQLRLIEISCNFLNLLL
jgi:hypothetical protein